MVGSRLARYACQRAYGAQAARARYLCIPHGSGDEGQYVIEAQVNDGHAAGLWRLITGVI
jgi:hypothetical protein